MKGVVCGMVTYSTYFTSTIQLQTFLNAHSLYDSEQILIQVFTALTDREEIILLRNQIHTLLPQAKIIGSTTDGEICSGTVSTGKTVLSISRFEHTKLKNTLIEHCNKSFETGEKIATKLLSPSTKLLITFTDGLHCNAEEYLKGISKVKQDVVIAGGMAGDNANFKRTFVFTETKISDNGAVGVALDSDTLYIHVDYSFNWQSIGKSMVITKVDQNRVYTIDDLPVYEIYRRYLGKDVADHLPAIGIEFPLIIQKDNMMIARAALMAHEDGSVSFGGNFKVGDHVSFGYGDAEMILDQSINSQYHMQNHPVESIFIYSCMARRRFMPNLIENEIKPFQKLCDVSGFFTYGEFYTFPQTKALLNQTMTVLTLSESEYTTVNDIIHREQTTFTLNDYQKSIKALSHLLNVTTQEMTHKNRLLEEKTKLIQAKKESLRLAQEIGHFGSWEIDLKSKKSRWSRESYHIYGIDPNVIEPTLDTFISLVLPEDRHKVSDVLKEAEDGEIKTLEVRAKRTDGEIIHILLNGKMLFDEKGTPTTLVGTTLDITEQVKLRTYNEELASIIENSSNEIYIIQKETYRYLYVNRAALDKLGYRREEMYNMNVLDINKELTLESVKYMEQKVIEEGSIFNRTTHTKKDGNTYPVQSYIQYSTYQNKEVAIIFDIDISDLVEAEQKQKKQAQILEQIHDSVISTDLNDIITHWNHGATIMHGYSAEEMVGNTIYRLYLKEDIQKIQWIKQQALLHGAFQDEIRKVTKSGDIIYTHVSLSVLKNESDEIIGLTYYSQDITQKKEIEEKLKEQTEQLNFQAYHDALTKLPNRILFEDRLEQAISNANKHHEKLGLLFIDLDNFKQINDTLGHHYGDEVLKIIAKRFERCIRHEDTLARLGGDEFTVLIQDLKTSESVILVAEKIIDSLKPKIILENHELHISASIGISLYPKDSRSKNDLLKYADTAMYKAKDEGRNNYQFYSEEMTQLAFEKATMEISLRNAISKNEFTVFYQPQIDARDNRIIGMEALVRWEHPQMGLVMPDKFIHIAEESNFIRELDYFVMHQAMSDVYQWYQEGLNPGILSLNLSIKQLMSDNFLQKLQDAIESTHFNVNWLELEITESQMMHDPMKSIERLQILNDMGIQIAIDDFGTGYSSLTYLKRLPVNTLKIDRSFIKDLPDDEEDRAISKAIIALAKSLNMKIIAEGVETSEQINYLLANGCHYIQGYYYSKAIDKEKMTHFIKNNTVIMP